MNEKIKNMNIVVNDLHDLRQRINWTEHTKSDTDFIDLRLRVNEIIDRASWVRKEMNNE